jgi:hypothetical protein
MDDCKNYSGYIVTEREIARWRLCIWLVDFCVTKTTGGWELASELDRKVNCVCVYILYTKIVPKMFT